jgi:hypothetical protein
MRIAGFLLVLCATVVLSLADGFGASVCAFVLCSSGALLIANRQLTELAREEAEEPDVRIRVVRWNY